MFFKKRNPKENLIKDLKNSKELYIRLEAISKKNGKYKQRATRQIGYIDDFIVYVKSLNATEIEELLNDA